jgi:hypothetical protein
VFCIGANQILLFFGPDNLDCIDEHESGMLKSSDIGRMFITVNANSKKTPFNP